jgi:hypothetical protein
LGYQNRLTGNAPQAMAVDVTKSSVREADDTQGIHSKSTRAISSEQTLPKQPSMRERPAEVIGGCHGRSAAIEQSSTVTVQQRPATISLTAAVNSDRSLVTAVQQRPFARNSNNDSATATVPSQQQCNSDRSLATATIRSQQVHCQGCQS